MALGSASDLAFMLEDAGVAVAFNGLATFGILEQSDALEGSESGGVMQVRVTTLLVQTSVFTNLRLEGSITAGGVPYRIDRASLEDDGALTRLSVAKTGR